MLTTIASFINAAIIQGIPLLFGSTGEIITEKSGNLNLGIPGIMYIGGISGIIGGYLYEHNVSQTSALLFNNRFGADVVHLLLPHRYP